MSEPFNKARNDFKSEAFNSANIKDYKGNAIAAFVIQDKATNKFVTAIYDIKAGKQGVSPYITSALMFESFEQSDNFRTNFLAIEEFKIVMITIELGEEF